MRVHVETHSQLYYWLHANGHSDKAGGFEIPDEHWAPIAEEFDNHPAHAHYSSEAERHMVQAVAALAKHERERLDTPIEVAVQRSRNISWVWVWRIAIALLLLVIAVRGKAEEPPAAAPMTVEDQSSVKDLRIAAFEALARVKDAETRKAQAELDFDRAQRDLAQANAAINDRLTALRTKYNAPESIYDVTAKYEWKPRIQPAPSPAATKGDSK